LENQYKDLPKEKMDKRLKIESKIDNLRVVEKEIDEISAKIGIKQDYYGKILVTTMEAVTNAIVHGNKCDENKFVGIWISYKKHILKITVTDEGKGFIPREIPDPTKPENIENFHGRGVFLMSRLADEIEFNKTGNEVTMSFKDIDK
jgi:serine/threonine-protein kinase RsbW